MTTMRQRRTIACCFLPVWAALLLAPSGWGEETAVLTKAADNDAEFLRLTKNDDGQMTAMQSAIATYWSAPRADGRVRVDLVAAIHVADDVYFGQLNRRFASYDSVLYELIAAADTRPANDQRQSASGVIGWMQGGMKDVLGLEFQLDQVDYTRDNFIHVDFSPEEFARVMRERGESFVKILFKAVGRSLATQQPAAGGNNDLAVLAAFFSPQRELQLKRILARQLVETDVAAFWEGPNGSTLITERNKKAIRVLEEEIKAGKKRLAIFYGAGHMADFHRRLTLGLDFQPGKTDLDHRLGPAGPFSEISGGSFLYSRRLIADTMGPQLLLALDDGD